MKTFLGIVVSYAQSNSIQSPFSMESHEMHRSSEPITKKVGYTLDYFILSVTSTIFVVGANLYF